MRSYIDLPRGARERLPLKGVLLMTAIAAVLAVAATARADLTIPLSGLSGANHKFMPADLDGDGKFDFVVCEAIDRYTDAGWFWAYKSDGTFMWKIQTSGQVTGYAAEFSHGFVCYDLDGDKKEEPYAHLGGKLVKLDPMTGKVIKEGPWPGSGRQQIIIAYLDGVRPHVVVSVSEGKTVWAYDKDLNPIWKSGGSVTGSHNVCQADVDGDGKDEISLGKCMLDHDGKVMWGVTLGGSHCDVHHVADIDLENPGLEVLMQTQGTLVGLFDAKTGKPLWTKTQTVGNWGCVGDIDLKYPGLECLTVASDKDAAKASSFSAIYTADGTKIGTPPDKPMAIWWDGTEKQTLKSIPQTFFFAGDIMGDWREEECYITGGKLTIKQATGTPKLNIPSLRTDRKYYVDIHRGTRGINGKYIQPLLSSRITDVGKKATNSIIPHPAKDAGLGSADRGLLPQAAWSMLGRTANRITPRFQLRDGTRHAATVLVWKGGSRFFD